MTASDILIHHVELSVVKEELLYFITMERERLDDFVGLTAIVAPAEAFETRAAEYGVNTNSKTGWDDLFHLFFVPDPRSLDDEMGDPDFLFNAPSIAHARDAKLGRIREQLAGRKLRGVTGESPHRMLVGDAVPLTNSGPEDPLGFIKRTAPMSRDHIAVKQEFVRRQRNIIRTKRAGRHPTLMTDLADASQQAVRDMSLHRRESAEELAKKLLGGPLVEAKVPPRIGELSKYL